MNRWKKLLALFLCLSLIFNLGIVIGHTIDIDTKNSINDNEVRGTPPGWSEDVRLTHTGRRGYPAITINGSDIHMVWENSTSPYGIYYRKSMDSGKTWTDEMKIDNSGAECPYAPKIVMNGLTIHVVWDQDTLSGFLETFYTKSIDNGETWSSPIQLSEGNFSNSYAPYIAVEEDYLFVVWQDRRDGQYEIYFKNSSDAGETWSIDKRLTTYALGSDTSSGLAVNGTNIHVLFARYVGNWETYYMNSTDSGQTWNSPVMISPSDGANSAGMDIAVNGSSVHIVWDDRRHLDGGEIYYRNSTDGGNSWNPEKRLTNNANFSQSPSLSVNGSNIHVVWVDTRDKNGFVEATELYYFNSTDNGITWGSENRLTNAFNHSIHPAIVSTGTDTHIVWMDNRTGNQFKYDIYYKRSPDFSDTSPSAHSNETPPPDSYRDAPGTNISVHVTDPSGVNESTIQLYVNGSLVTHTSIPITDGFNVSYESPGFEPGVVECRIVADDNCSNTLDYTWNFTVLALYEIQLHEGWNLISVPHVQVDRAINEVLKDIDGKWDYIQWYDATSGEWKTNATFKPQQLNDLFVINRTMAFWINITEPDVNLTVRGHISTLTEIPLYAGWNLVGYPTQATETVANSLWGTGADRVEVFDPIEPYRIKEVGATYIMKPGEGYWVHVAVDSTWIVDW